MAGSFSLERNFVLDLERREHLWPEEDKIHKSPEWEEKPTIDEKTVYSIKQRLGSSVPGVVAFALTEAFDSLEEAKEGVIVMGPDIRENLISLCDGVVVGPLPRFCYDE